MTAPMTVNEALAKLRELLDCEDSGCGSDSCLAARRALSVLSRAIETARSEEREACAKLVEDTGRFGGPDRVAALIRCRAELDRAAGGDGR
jgi:hypothetical protein